MKVYKKTTKQVEIVDDIICNKCGESLKVFLGNTGVHDFYGMAEVTVSGGYESEHIEDLTEYSFALCEKCLVELFKSFKIPVEEKEYLIGE